MAESRWWCAPMGWEWATGRIPATTIMGVMGLGYLKPCCTSRSHPVSPRPLIRPEVDRMPRSPLPARRALVSAAEKLFAEGGVGATTIAAVTREAGQRNKSAVAFHYGSKDGLVRAVLDKHQHRIDRRRTELLDAGAGFVEALVVPLAERLDDPDGGCAYLHIQAQMLARSGPVSDNDRSGVTRLLAMPESPSDPDLAALLVSVVFHGLSDFELRKPDFTREEREAFTKLLMDAISKMLDA